MTGTAIGTLALAAGAMTTWRVADFRGGRAIFKASHVAVIASPALRRGHRVRAVRPSLGGWPLDATRRRAVAGDIGPS